LISTNLKNNVDNERLLFLDGENNVEIKGCFFNIKLLPFIFKYHHIDT